MPAAPPAARQQQLHARAARACAAAPQRGCAALRGAAQQRAVPRRASLALVRADAGAAPAALTGSNEVLLKTMGDAIADVQALPPSQRNDGYRDAAKTVKAALSALKTQGGVALFDSYTGRTLRRNVRARAPAPHAACSVARATPRRAARSRAPPPRRRSCWASSSRLASSSRRSSACPPCATTPSSS
jgi:hypothetical protein